MKNKGISPESLNEMAQAVDTLRADFLLGADGAEGIEPEAEQFFLSALAMLAVAQRQMTLAALKQSQALASSRR